MPAAIVGFCLRGRFTDAAFPYAFRRLHGAVSPGRRQPHTVHRARQRAGRVARPARLRRGVDRRAPLRRLRDHRQSRAVHRRRGGAHQAHQARNRRRVAALPQPDDGGRPPDAARPPDTRARDVRRRSGAAAFGRHHARHRSAPAARHDGRGSRRDHSASARRGGDEEDRLVRAARRPPAARSVQPAASGDRGGGLGLSLRTAHRRALGNLHALPRCHQPGRVQRPRPPLGHL